MAKQTPEGRVKNKVKEVLKAHGVWFYMPMQNGFGVVGIPDFICCWRGRFFAIETKAKGRIHTLTANQKQRIAEIREAGGLAIVVDDPKQLEDWLNVYEEQKSPS